VLTKLVATGLQGLNLQVEGVEAELQGLLRDKVLDVAKNTNIIKSSSGCSDDRLGSRDARCGLLDCDTNLVHPSGYENLELGGVAVDVTKLLDDPYPKFFQRAPNSRLDHHRRRAEW